MLVNNIDVQKALSRYVTQCTKIKEIHWHSQGGCWYDGSVLVSGTQYASILAPKVDAALRAAFLEGWELRAPGRDCDPSVGVAVGIQKLGEKA